MKKYLTVVSLLLFSTTVESQYQNYQQNSHYHQQRASKNPFAKSASTFSEKSAFEKGQIDRQTFGNFGQATTIAGFTLVGGFLATVHAAYDRYELQRRIDMAAATMENYKTGVGSACSAVTNIGSIESSVSFNKQIEPLNDLTDNIFKADDAIMDFENHYLQAITNLVLEVVKFAVLDEATCPTS